MIRIVLFFLLVGGVFSASGQNYISNPSFEDYQLTICGYAANGKEFNSLFIDWHSPTHASPDLFTYDAVQEDGRVCNNYPDGTAFLSVVNQEPKDGKAMIGLMGLYNVKVAREYREYIQIKLSEPLLPGFDYHYGFYINLADVSRISVKELGLYFSYDSVYSDTTNALPVIPQITLSQPITDKDKWVFVNGVYRSQGQAWYLTMGNFNNFNNSEIIDVDSTFSNNGGAFEKVAYYLIDSVFIEPLPKIKIPNVITPNGDNINDKFIIGGLQPERWGLQIINRWGLTIYKSRTYNNDWEPNNLEPGIYFYELTHNFLTIKHKGFIHLIK